MEYPDGTWTFVELASDMTEADLDDIVYRITPPHLRTGTTPSFLSAGATRTAAEKQLTPPADDRPQYAAGPTSSLWQLLKAQIEYITENGLEAWQTKVAQIKADNPKPCRASGNSGPQQP